MSKFRSEKVELDFKELNIIKHALKGAMDKNKTDIRLATDNGYADKQCNELIDNKLVYMKIRGVLDKFYIKEDYHGK